MPARFINLLVYAQVDFLILERLHQALSVRAVLKITALRHVDADFQLFE
jgi:hypothetical protein